MKGANAILSCLYQHNLKCGQKILYTIAILMTIAQGSLISDHNVLRFDLFCNLTLHNNKLFFFKTNIDNNDGGSVQYSCIS